jgi:replicative DNA helicase
MSLATPLAVDLDTERAVLGQILTWPNAWTWYAAAGLTQLDFWRAAHALVFQAAAEVAEDGEEVGYPAVTRRLRDRERIDQVGVGYLSELLAGVPQPSARSAADCVGRLQRLALTRLAAGAARDLAGACDEARDGLEPEEIAGHLSRIDRVSRRDTATAGSDAEGQLQALADERERERQQAVGLGLPMLDETLGGLRPGDVCGVMARTGVGKTLLACHVARSLAQAGAGQVFISLEMPLAEIVARLARAEFGFDRYRLLRALETGTFDRDTYRTRFARLHIFDEPSLSLARITSLVAFVQRQQPVSLVTIDYLGLIGGDRSSSTYERVSQQARDLKDMAKRLHVAVLVLIQVSRAGGADGSEELGITAVRDSGVIEEALDYLVALRRVDRSKSLSDEVKQRYTDVLWASVIKNRHGHLTRREVAVRVNATSLALHEDQGLVLDTAAVQMARRPSGQGAMRF